MNRLLSLVAVIVSVFPSLASAAPPTKFPTLGRESAEPMVVVATVRPGKYLPQFAECADPNTVCMDPPPFWFKANVVDVVYGKGVPRRLSVATTNHFGMPVMEMFGRKPILISLLTDGREFLMPRYAMGELTRDKSGSFHLVVLRSEPIWWLPCSVSELREEIDSSDFPGNLELPKENAKVYMRDSPALFRATANGAMPLYAIPVARIRAHLASLKPTSSQMVCERK